MSKKMNPAIKKKWLAALRSGKYKQGKRKLRHAGRFCCLGVLCNLHAQAHPEIAASQTSAVCYLHETDVLPDAVRIWAGLESCDGSDGALADTSLVQMNDGVGCKPHNFLQIAKVIEKHL